MKTLFTTILLTISCSIFSQSYFNTENQSSQSLGLKYAPSSGIDVTTLEYIISNKGRMDISPSLSYGSSFGISALTASLPADYYFLKQNTSIPLSMSLGVGYHFIRISGFNESTSAHVGEGRVGLYHNISVDKVQIVPKASYHFQFNLEEFGANANVFEIGVAVAYQLKNNSLITVIPSLILTDSDTQFQIGAAYVFGRVDAVEN